MPVWLQARWPLPHYVWVGVLLLGLLGALHWVSRPAAVAGVHNIAQAMAEVPQAPQVGVKQVTLPHILDDEAPRWHDRVDYRLTWPADLSYTDRETARLGLLLPRVGTRFRVLLNGSEIHNVGWYAAPERTVNTAWFPHLVALPGALLTLRPQDNELHIQVQARVLERSGLWPLQLGSHDRLFERHAVLELWQVTGTWMMTITALLMALMSLFLWVSLRERLFVLMAAAAVAHMVRLWLSVVLEPALSYEWYFLLHRVSFTLYVGFFCLIMEDLLGLRLRLVRALALFLLVVGPSWILLVLYTQEYDFYRIWAGILAIVSTACLGLMVVYSLWRRQFKPDQLLVLLVALFTLLTGVRDFLVVQLNFPGDADLRWMSAGGLALMFTLGWVLLQRATASAREVHRLNGSLAETVARREAELRSAFEQLRQSEQQRAVEGERRRLMRDMHDGLGSQLVQTLNMVRSNRDGLDQRSIEHMVHHALEELRMTLDSLEPMEGDLPTILGTLRSRVAPALQAAGITLQWQVQEVPALSGLDARGVMHLFRCVQEIFANVVKHAHARRVTVRTWADATAVYLAVEDDGIGLPPNDQRSEGRGLGNIAVRAEKIGAEVRFYATWPGTGVEFAFPIQGKPPAWSLTQR
ncbi:sensor histidine kinase [Macromonas nakdongensis]|uniref:sensor histidine kinase n=1 Tax=Macromonas nakdongensis TaxID=1843082 RepID=UPI000C3250C1|nr:ATP-binding protein [Macromonas nakdongensis]